MTYYFKGTVGIFHELFGVAMILIAILTFYSPTLAQTDGQDFVIGKFRTLDSKILGEQRRVWVHLPDGYERSKNQYPVLYKCDAIDYRMFASRVGDLFLPVLRGQTPQVILVSIENTDRNRDMYPVKGNKPDITPGADKFLGFIKEELIPFIEKEYRANGYRILMGESNSAMFAIYALLENPQLFNGYIASSPELDYFFEYFKDLARFSFISKDFSRRNLFMIHGENDNPRVLRSTPKFVDILKQHESLNLRWKLEVLVNEGHVPPSSMVKGLIYVFDGYKMPAEIAEKGYKAVDEYYKNFGEKHGFNFMIPAHALNQLASHLVSKKKPDEALKIYEDVLAKYHAADLIRRSLVSMASIYKEKGNLESAEKCYRKVMEIYPSAAGVFERRIKELKKEK